MLYPKYLKLHDVIWDVLVKSTTLNKLKRHQVKKKTKKLRFPVDVELFFVFLLFGLTEPSRRKAMRDVFVLFSL